MSVLLAIDTSTQACSAALLYEGELIQELSGEPRSHTRLLLPMIDRLLAAAGCKLQQLDAIAYTAGPGSFTGLRIGMGVVQGLAFGADLPVIGVSSLETLALGAQRQLNLTGKQLIIPAFDARMGEIYWAVYRAGASQSDQTVFMETVTPDSLTAPESVAAELAVTGPVCGVGEGWQYAQQFAVTAGAIHSELLPEAQDAARLAEPLLQQGRAVSVEQAELMYLRDTVSWKKRQRLRQP